jgi:hypothetical protein
VTEQEWLVCKEPEKMLEFLRRKVSDRKLRLFAVACCRQNWHLLTDERSRTALEVAERFADGMASLAELQNTRPPLYTLAAHACYNATEVFTEIEPGTMIADCAAENAAWGTAKHGVMPPDDNSFSSIFNTKLSIQKDIQSKLLRCILLNPFRPVTLVPAWKTPAVVQLARCLYEERRFEDMPVLADALEEAGCQDATVLGHCRGSGPHVQGCWVVDLLLGKE